MQFEEDESPNLGIDEKRAFVEAVSNFHRYGESIYSSSDIAEMIDEIRGIIETAEALTLQESEHWFDNVTVSRHMKQLKESYKVFEKTAKEMQGLQQRLEACYDDMGSVLNKYYKVNESLHESTSNLYEDEQGNFDFGPGEVEDIFEKFKKIPRVRRIKNGYQYKFGTGYLIFVTDASGKPVAALYDTDRVNNFLVHMEQLGFGPDIFATLEKLAKKSSLNGYTTKLVF